MSNERAPNCQRTRNQTVAFMTIEKIQDEMTYLAEELEEENRDSLSNRQTERLDAFEQLIDALNVDLEEYYL